METTFDDANLENLIAAKYTLFKYFYIWGKGVIISWEIEVENRPLKLRIKELNEEKKKSEEILEKLNEEVEILIKEVSKVKKECEEIMKTQKELEDQQQTNERRKINANKLISLLASEEQNWSAQLKDLLANEKNFEGNIFLSASIIGYLGPFSGTYRNEQLIVWKDLCTQVSMAFSENYNFQEIMTNQVEIRKWNVADLPSDKVSIENGIIFTNSPKFPLLIDPQGQGLNWVKKMYDKGEQSFSSYKEGLKTPEEKKYFPLDLQLGRTVLFESVKEEIDTELSTIVSQNFFVEDDIVYVLFNSEKKEVEIQSFFAIFTTKLNNPHYLPEYFIKLNIINFTVTFNGLCDQLLTEVFKKEKEQDFLKRNELINEMGRNNARLEEFQEKILKSLSAADESTILDNEDLISTLEESTKTSGIDPSIQPPADEDVKNLSTEFSQQEQVWFFFNVIQLGRTL